MEGVLSTQLPRTKDMYLLCHIPHSRRRRTLHLQMTSLKLQTTLCPQSFTVCFYTFVFRMCQYICSHYFTDEALFMRVLNRCDRWISICEEYRCQRTPDRNSLSGRSRCCASIYSMYVPCFFSCSRFAFFTVDWL